MPRLLKLIFRPTMAFSGLPSLWAKSLQDMLSASPSRAAPSEGAAIPRSAPFSAGLDAELFQRHYLASFQSRKRRVAQAIFNIWYFYVTPFLLGMIPGKLFADLLHPVTREDMIHWWMLTLMAQAVIGALLIRYRGRHKAHRRYEMFYKAALEACLKEDAGRDR